MTIATTTVHVQARATVIRVTSSLTPTPTTPLVFYWYIDGRYVGSTRQGERTFSLLGSLAGTVDVVDSIDPTFDPRDPANMPRGYPATRRIWWRRSLATGVRAYEVSRQKSGGSAEVVAVIPHHDQTWSYEYRTPVLDDLSEYTFEVAAVGAEGNLGTAASSVETIVRHPDVPNWSVAWDSGSGRVTFSEVA